jgi:hypothetical protein
MKLITMVCLDNYYNRICGLFCKKTNSNIIINFVHWNLILCLLVGLNLQKIINSWLFITLLSSSALINFRRSIFEYEWLTCVHATLPNVMNFMYVH